jgi:hypothetical protein
LVEHPGRTIGIYDIRHPSNIKREALKREMREWLREKYVDKYLIPHFEQVSSLEFKEPPDYKSRREIFSTPIKGTLGSLTIPPPSRRKDSMGRIIMQLVVPYRLIDRILYLLVRKGRIVSKNKSVQYKILSGDCLTHEIVISKLTSNPLREDADNPMLNNMVVWG